MDADARVAERVVAVATHLDGRLDEVTRDLRDVLSGEIHELDGDVRIVDLLGASIQGNIATILHMLAHDIPAQRVQPPSAAFEYARRLAQRGVPVNALVRAYRVGHERLLEWALDDVARSGDDAQVAALATRRLIADTFAYIDHITQQVVEVYEAERERWLAHRGTVRADRIREVLADDSPVDVDATESVLGYALRGRHLGLVVWTAQREPAAIERFVLALAEGPGFVAGPLISAYDRSTAWVWMPVTSPECADAVGAVATEHAVQVACGEVAAGVAGFRRTHRQAQRAHAVALAGGTDAPVTAFADVGAVALLCADLDGARTWVAGVLGPLAADDDQHARLRETLLVFLTCGSSYTAAAELLTLHRNSVRYRVARAEQVRGRPIRDDRFDVEFALRACRWLGAAVLRS